MADVTRQPVNVSVSGSEPVRAGSYPGPYQIINTSLDATVWAANNTSVYDGAGTPIYPGTSVPWTSSGDLFLILGTDTQSVAAGSAAIVLSYDVSDWQPNPIAIATAILNSGVLVIDHPVQLVPSQTLTVPPLVKYDVSRFNSLMLNFAPTGAGPYPRIIQVNWWNPAGTQIVSNFSVHFLTATNWNARIPCKTGVVSFDYGFGTLTFSIDISVVGSYRQAITLFDQDTPFNNFLSAGTVAVPPGVLTLITTSAPWFGAVDVTIDVTLVGAALNPFGYIRITRTHIAANNALFIPLGVNAAAVTINNMGAVAAAFGGDIGGYHAIHHLWGAPIAIEIFTPAAAGVTVDWSIVPVRT